VSAGQRDRRIAELEAENKRLRAELARIRRSRSRYTNKRQAAIDSGTWEPFTDPGPARDHMRAVMTVTGITANAYANISGVNCTTVTAVLGGGKSKIRTVSAEKLLAVTADVVAETATDARVDATGTRRRLQALTVQGWGLPEIARRTGANYSNLAMTRAGGKKTVAASTRRAVAAAYEALRTLEPPCGTKGERMAAGRSRALAGREGWAAHWAWDDDSVDDPGARPAEGWRRCPERKRRDSAGLAADARELFAFGLSRKRAAERLGVTLAALEKALERCPLVEEAEAA
jgi:hypothetical protein